MSPDFPIDADGDALRRVARNGGDMTLPMDIDSTVAAPNENSAHEIAKAILAQGYLAHASKGGVGSSWSVYCTKRMLATHPGVLAAQGEIDLSSRPFGGYADGWGTFGNATPPDDAELPLS